MPGPVSLTLTCRVPGFCCGGGRVALMVRITSYNVCYTKLLREVEEQLRHIRESVAQLPLLLEQGYALLITHGNGPVVGQLLLQNEAARATVPPMPLDVCDADSEGSIVV